jgi:protein HIRA/HIR1
MAITAHGSLTVWNTTLKKAIFPPLSVASLLTSSATRTTPHPAITTSALLPNGTPLITLSSGSTHSYDSELCAWTRVSDTWWSKGSDFWEGRRGKANMTGRGVIRMIESAINDIVVDSQSMDLTGATDSDSDSDSDDSDEDDGDEKDAAMVQGGEDKEKKLARKKRKKKKTAPEGEPEEELGTADMYRVAMSLAHLEVRMKAAVALDSPSEYRTFLLAYAKKLAEEGIRGKAEELVRELLGPVYL